MEIGTIASGGARTVDRVAGSRLVGFRNPGARHVTGSAVLQQADEGQFVQCDSLTSSITIPALDISTQITIINRQNTPVNLLTDIGLTDGIEWFDGAGSFPLGDRIIAGGCVVHIRYRTGVGVSLWGNGIT